MPIHTGQKTVAAAGTAETLGSQLINASLTVKALTTNNGLVFVGNVNDDVASTNGMPLAAGDLVIYENVGNLSNIWVDSAINGEGVAWMVINV